jgi:hypothetical protein
VPLGLVAALPNMKNPYRVPRDIQGFMAFRCVCAHAFGPQLPTVPLEVLDHQQVDCRRGLDACPTTCSYPWLETKYTDKAATR